MKVLLLAPPLDGVGGIQRYTETLKRALGDLVRAENVRCITMAANGARTKSVRLPLSSKWRFVIGALQESLRWRSDLILCTHLSLAPVAWLLAKLQRRPYWVVVYGIEAWRWLPRWKRKALYEADRVLAISAFSREQVLKTQQLRRERMLSLPCALDDHLLKAERIPDPLGELLPLRRSALDARRLILTVARLAASEQYKGHDVVLRALPQVIACVPDLTYLIVGDGDDRIRLQSLASDLGLEKHVIFTGELTDAQLAACYRASEVFVMPASTHLDPHLPKGEGFGIVFLEAMAFAKPVIGPNCGAPAEIIQDGVHGILVDPGSSEAVATALIRLLGAPEDARRLGQAAKETVTQAYSYDSFRARLRAALSSSFSLN